MSDPASDDMSFLDHLEILRWHLIRSIGAIVLVALLLFANKSLLFDGILFSLLREEFITYQWLCDASAWLNLQFPTLIAKDSICIGQNLPTPQNLVMAGQFLNHILVSLVGGLALAFPYVFWEIWRFIRPALNPGELKYSRGTVFFTSILFTLGALFGFFIICPLSVNFFLNYQVSELVQNVPTLNSYISTIVTVVLGCAIIFELPILVFFLSKIGVLSPGTMRSYRKHSFVGALVLSAIITPPDVFSQLLVSVPLVFLYEVSIYISAWVANTEQKKLSE